MTDSPVDDDPTRLAARIEAGARALPELPSPDAERLAPALADIPRALGVGFLSPLFSALATWPEWFEVAWARTSPRLGGPDERAAADAVRAAARRATPAEPGDPVSPELAAYLRLLDSLLPRLLVLARAWYDADGGSGPEPVGGPRPTLDPTTAPRGEMDADAEGALQDLTAAHGHPRVLSVYRAVAAGGPLFTSEAPELLRRAADPAHLEARLVLRDAAVVPGLASGVPAPPEGAAEILALFGARLIPDLILDTEWLRRRAGTEGASA